MEEQEHIEKMKKIQNYILNFIDKDQEEVFQTIKQEIEDSKITKDSHLFRTFLYMLSKILSNHYRYPHFFSKIEKIVQTYKKGNQSIFYKQRNIQNIRKKSTISFQ